MMDNPVAVDAAVAGAAASTTKSSEVTLSNGTVLAIKRVAPLTIRAAATAVPEPEVPVVTLENGRQQKNPSDPVYLAEIKKHELNVVDSVVNVLVLMGTALVSVPEGVSKPDDDDWIENLEILGIGPRVDSPRHRYLAWCRHVAFEDENDLAVVVTAVGNLSGISEKEVALAAQSFRSDEGRRANPPEAITSDY